MKFAWLLVPTAIITMAFGATAAAQNSISHPETVQPTSLSYYDSYYAQDDEQEEASPSDKPAVEESPAAEQVPCVTCGACPCDCKECCGDGDPWTFMDHFFPCCDIKVGGWTQWGYHTETTGLFNRHPDRFNNHQSWVFVEKEADADACTWDWGFRFDAVYGTDGPDTQAFGNPAGSWDFLNGFDHGIYGWALPQLYADVAYGDVNIRLGHFYAIHGYEVVQAPQNFFYSHALTYFLSEPFTHTGILASYAVNEDTTLYGGWTLGWDSGFDQSDQGSSFLGGFGVPVLGDATFRYMVAGGNFGWRGRNAYNHSLVLEWPITERLTYVGQSDLLRVRSTGEDTVGINQYLFWEYNKCVTVGGRVEWFRGDTVTGFNYVNRIGSGPQFNLPSGTHSFYEATLGVNLRPHPNLVFRPEIRYDWAPFADYSQSIFGIDMVVTF